MLLEVSVLESIVFLVSGMFLDGACSNENFIEELKPFDIVFVNYCNKLIKKTIYPLVFKIDKPGDIKSKEERIKKVAYLPIGEFLKKCSYENVKTMIIEAISK